MKRGPFSQEQIITILHQAEKGEQTLQAICKEHRVTETTVYRWRKVYGGMSVSEASRLQELEKENARLKRLLAERDLARDAWQESLAKKEPTKPNAPPSWPTCSNGDSPNERPATTSVSTGRRYAMSPVLIPTPRGAKRSRRTRRSEGGACGGKRRGV
jgi:putative transposase